MLTTLKRINELAAIERKIGLNEEQLAERSILRKEYLKQIRGQVTANLENIKVV